MKCTGAIKFILVTVTALENAP